ncbi:DUF2946 domain-containing protein [Tatumella sp. UBA2305]|uniref:DUF2946 domain-containing protein n=1 Tax=Tatumella sp. UBA2305 TaxID=1947647 RepID=UPI0025D3DE49|nr:DUF2946 domain-containing protein [Tatumella sp. UBA2305]
MSFLIRLSHTKLPAVIAILAILMLFIAPEISRSLQNSSATPTASISASSEMAMPGMSVTAHIAMEKHAAPHSAPAVDPMSGMDDIACGYCVMLLHMPVLLAMMVFLCWFSLLLRRAPPARRHYALPVRLFTGDLQPRGPPLRC